MVTTRLGRTRRTREYVFHRSIERTPKGQRPLKNYHYYGPSSDIRHERGDIPLLHRQPLHAGQHQVLSGAQLRQKFHHGQQSAERHGYRQRHTAQTFAGDWFSMHLTFLSIELIDYCGFPVTVLIVGGGGNKCVPPTLIMTSSHII